MDIWAEMGRPAPEAVVVKGITVRAGSRVRLEPRASADVVDLALAGRVAVVEGIDQSLDGALHVAVTLDDDPGRDLGGARYPGHRFFFHIDEIDPLEPASSAPHRILVAGIGNIFLGDDGFGVAVARVLAERSLPAGVTVVDFGIRGLDLAYAMQEDYDVVLLVDAMPRGGAPGTVYVVEPTLEPEGHVIPDAHGMDPVRVLHLARALGRVPPRTIVVGCEPQTILAGETHEDVLVQLSAPVARAVDDAARTVESLIAELVAAARDRDSEMNAADRQQGGGASP